MCQIASTLLNASLFLKEKGIALEEIIKYYKTEVWSERHLSS